MTVTAKSICVRFIKVRQHIHGATHIMNVFPGHTLSVDDVTQELKAFVHHRLELASGILSLFETKCVGTDDNVAFLAKCNSGVMHLIAREAGRLTFAQMILAVMLMPDRNTGSRSLRGDTTGD